MNLTSNFGISNLLSDARDPLCMRSKEEREVVFVDSVNRMRIHDVVADDCKRRRLLIFTWPSLRSLYLETLSVYYSFSEMLRGER